MDRSVVKHSATFSPEVIEDIQVKAELGHYRIRGWGTIKRVPNFDDLTFVPSSLSRVPLEGYREKCVTRTEIGGRHGALRNVPREALRSSVTGRRRLVFRAGTGLLLLHADRIA